MIYSIMFSSTSYIRTPGVGLQMTTSPCYNPEYGLSLLYLSADGKSNKQWWASKTRENAFALHAF
jgi:hypothetical protein